jgi:hypothetical protein
MDDRVLDIKPLPSFHLITWAFMIIMTKESEMNSHIRCKKDNAKIQERDYEQNYFQIINKNNNYVNK